MAEDGVQVDEGAIRVVKGGVRPVEDLVQVARRVVQVLRQEFREPQKVRQSYVREPSTLVPPTFRISCFLSRRCWLTAHGT